MFNTYKQHRLLTSFSFSTTDIGNANVCSLLLSRNTFKNSEAFPFLYPLLIIEQSNIGDLGSGLRYIALLLCLPL